MTILTTSLPEGLLARRYLAGLDVTGGIPPYSFRLVGGSLPPGLTLWANTGTMAGHGRDGHPEAVCNSPQRRWIRAPTVAPAQRAIPDVVARLAKFVGSRRLLGIWQLAGCGRPLMAINKFGENTGKRINGCPTIASRNQDVRHKADSAFG